MLKSKDALELSSALGDFINTSQQNKQTNKFRNGCHSILLSIFFPNFPI